MFSWKPWVALLVLLLVAVVPVLAMIDESLGRGGPPPEDYFRTYGPSGGYADARCRQSDGVALARLGSRGPGHIFPGGGGDMVTFASGGVAYIYDSASGRTGKDHDLLVIAGLRPDDIDFVRKGPHLLFCGRSAPLEVMVLRQYCRGDSPDGPWNNEVEEIAFPSAREIWITDELYARYDAPKDLLAAIRTDEIDELKQTLTRNPESWKVHPFSDMLPGDWFASWACRHDLQ